MGNLESSSTMKAAIRHMTSVFKYDKIQFDNNTCNINKVSENKRMFLLNSVLHYSRPFSFYLWIIAICEKSYSSIHNFCLNDRWTRRREVAGQILFMILLLVFLRCTKSVLKYRDSGYNVVS